MLILTLWELGFCGLLLKGIGCKGRGFSGGCQYGHFVTTHNLFYNCALFLLQGMDTACIYIIVNLTNEGFKQMTPSFPPDLAIALLAVSVLSGVLYGLFHAAAWAIAAVQLRLAMKGR